MSRLYLEWACACGAVATAPATPGDVDGLPPCAECEDRMMILQGVRHGAPPARPSREDRTLMSATLEIVWCCTTCSAEDTRCYPAPDSVDLAGYPCDAVCDGWLTAARVTVSQKPHAGDITSNVGVVIPAGEVVRQG